MIHNIYTRGFTIIELLMVISIIALLSSIVLSSMSTSRNLAIDRNVQSSLFQVRSEMEFARTESNGYVGLCDSPRVSNMLDQIASVLQINRSEDDSMGCAGTATQWRAYAPLRTGGVWCVNYEGRGVWATTHEDLGFDCVVTP